MRLNKDNKEPAVTLKDIYKTYRKLGGKLNKQQYRILTDKLFKKISEMILDGGVWHIGENLGYVCIKAFKKELKLNYKGNITNGVVDWNTSNQIRKDLESKGIETYNKETDKGAKWIVYYEDPINYRWAWIKKMSACTIENSSIWSFETTNDNHKLNGVERLGNKGKLKKLLREQPEQKLKYIYDIK
jgi:hypothetical protein